MLILSTPDVLRITLARDPISRFKSYCGHSTRDNPNKAGVGFWQNTDQITQPLNADALLNCCIKYMQSMLLYGERIGLGNFNTSLSIPIYSQWWLSSFKSYYDPEIQKLTYCANNFYDHIIKTRGIVLKGQSLHEYMHNFLASSYAAIGLTESIDEFVKELINLGIFTKTKLIPHANSSEEVQIDRATIFQISERVVGEYYAIVPEDFYFYYVCKCLKSQKSNAVGNLP